MKKEICKTKIVATIGPASDDISVLQAMVEAGMDVMRLNFSHGSHEEHLQRIKHLRLINEKLDCEVAIMLDTKGPEVRTHEFENGEVNIKKGSIVRIAMNKVLGTAEIFSVTHPNLIYDVEVGSTLLIDDGNLTLMVVEKDFEKLQLICLSHNNATLKNRRGINVPHVKLSLPFLSHQDKEDLIFGCRQGVDFVAASFVSSAAEVLEMRAFLNEQKGENIQIIAKIENTLAISNFNEILAVADGIMVARGDLGVEIPLYEVPIFQRTIIEKCHFANKPVIVATQMLESMQFNSRPTRAEVNDVATAVLAGSDAIMLSAETASGKYPVEAIETMNQIAIHTEKEINYRELMLQAQKARVTDVATTIALSVVDAALQLPVCAIITPTISGFTARAVSHFRPRVPIVALTMDRNVMRKLALTWGIYPIMAKLQTDFDKLIAQGIEVAGSFLEFEPNDLVIITAGIPINIAKSTNMMKIEKIK